MKLTSEAVRREILKALNGIEAFIEEHTREIARLARRLDELESFITHERTRIMATLDDLSKQVQANTSAEASAVQLIQGLAAQIAASAQDPARIAALAASLKTSADALGAAVVANTPAAPAPADAPTAPAS